MKGVKNMTRKVLILGAGNAQYDAIKYCKEKGFEVYGCSYTDTDKSIPLLDHFEKINIIDVDEVKEYAMKINADIVYSVGSDVAMPTACKVSEQLNLPYFVSSETAIICNNKQQMRDYLGSDFEGNVHYFVSSNKDDLNEETLNFFPMMMKPVDSQGQRGVRLVSNMDEVLEEYDESMSHSKSKKIIFEEYLNGPEISVNAYVYEKELKFFLVSDRVSFEEYPGGIIKEHHLPTKESPVVVERIRAVVERVVNKLNIENGPVYFQIKIVNDVPYVIEVTPRLDGCHMWNVIKEYCGFDLLDATFQHLLGNEQLAFCMKEKEGKFKLVFTCEKPNTAFDRSKYIIPDKCCYLRWYYENGDNVRVLNGFMEKGGYYIEEVK